MLEQKKKLVFQSIDTAASIYYSLVLLVGDASVGKTRLIRSVAKESDSNVVNVNWSLSGRCLDLTKKERPLRIATIFKEITQGSDETVFLDNLEVLFDQDLKLNPLRLLQDISRDRVVIATWSGYLDNGKLYYADNGHPEFREYNVPDTLVVDLNATERIITKE